MGGHLGMDARIVIAGGGGAGLMAGIAAARQGAKVLILDQKEKPGKKLYATGNGRCNFTNLRQEKECYRGGDPDFVMRALGRFGLPETLALFRELGLKEREINGYLYPYSGQAKDVVSLLLNELDALSVTVCCSERVEDIRKESRGFLIRTRSADPKNPSGKEPDCVERTYHAAFVILAPGGCASYRLGSDGSGYELAKRLGHSVIPPVPALVALKIRQNMKPVSGVRFFGSGELYSQVGRRMLAAEKGEFLFTDYGISGIPVMQMSRFAAKELQAGETVVLRLNLIGDMPEEEQEEQLERRLSGTQNRTALQALTGLIQEKLIRYVLRECGIRDGERPDAVPKEKKRTLAKLIRSLELDITGTNSFENAQVCAGGVPLREISDDMESLICPGLYLAGELLDVDGTCGGYNLQWAWTSGWIAGSRAGRLAVRREQGSRRAGAGTRERKENRYDTN